jgi:lipopolysaccharide export LptBFGC system permease protein LptF
MVSYHQAISGPFNCVLALLLGVPFAIAGNRVNPMVGATKAIGIFVGYFLLAGICRMFGEQGFLIPVVAGWLPMGLMTFYALILIVRLC